MTTKHSRERSRTPLIAVVGLVVIVAGALLAALLFGGDETTTATTANAALIPTTDEVSEVGSVVTSGSSLVAYDSAQDADPARGEVAPTITASHFDGSQTTIDFTDGQPRVLLFFAHWCPHCQNEITTLVSRFELAGTPDNIEIIAISTSVDEGAPNYPPSRWFLRERWPIPVLRDSAEGDLAAAFGLTGFPFTVAIDSDGTVMQRQSGIVPEAQWNAMLDLAAAA